MPVLAVGAIGRVSRRVVERLFDAGHDVAGLARNSSTLPATAHAVAGDVRDTVVVREALTAGDGDPVDAVVSALETLPDEDVDDGGLNHRWAQRPLYPGKTSPYH